MQTWTRRAVLAGALTALLPRSAAAQAPARRIEATAHQAVKATITYEAHTTAFAVSRWTVYLPEPPELPSQAKVKATTTPAGKVVAEKSPLARKLRLIEVPVANPRPGSLTVRMEVQAALRSRKLVPLKAGEKPPAVAALTPSERKYYLAPSQRIDFDRPAFKEWLDAKKLRRAKGESPLDLAARVLAVIRSDYDYRYDPAEERRASVSCGRSATDCGGMTLVFVAAMRANDVPARVLVGRLAKPRKRGAGPADTEYDQPHVRAELYVDRVGWVPVDPAYANAEKRQPVESFVGTDPGDLLVLHVGLDLRVPLPGQERTAEMLQLEPFVWVAGQGRLDVAFGPSGWDVEVTPLGRK
jgi:transglutaminase-like putative cysteine protease